MAPANLFSGSTATTSSAWARTRLRTITRTFTTVVGKTTTRCRTAKTTMPRPRAKPSGSYRRPKQREQIPRCDVRRSARGRLWRDDCFRPSWPASSQRSDGQPSSCTENKEEKALGDVRRVRGRTRRFTSATDANPQSQCNTHAGQHQRCESYTPDDSSTTAEVTVGGTKTGRPTTPTG